MNDLELYFFEKLDVYYRMTDAHTQLEKQVHQSLGVAMDELVRAKLGDGWESAFGADTFITGWTGDVHRTNWEVPIKGTAAYQRYPGLWFPADGQDFELKALLGMAPGRTPQALLWATPISHATLDLGWAKEQWQSLVEPLLNDRTWSRHRWRNRSPNETWGSVRNVVIDHRTLLEGLRSGDLMPALRPFAECLDDLAAVAEPITELVERARARQAAIAK